MSDLKLDEAVKKVGLIRFSDNENLSLELIDDAIDSTFTFHKNMNIKNLAERIKVNVAKCHASRS